MIDFGRSPQWNCPLPDGEGGPGHHGSTGRPTPPPARGTAEPWYIPGIPCHEPEDGVFYIHIGPSGGERGYNAITGKVEIYDKDVDVLFPKN